MRRAYSADEKSQLHWWEELWPLLGNLFCLDPGDSVWYKKRADCSEFLLWWSVFCVLQMVKGLFSERNADYDIGFLAILHSTWLYKYSQCFVFRFPGIGIIATMSCDRVDISWIFYPFLITALTIETAKVFQSPVCQLKQELLSFSFSFSQGLNYHLLWKGLGTLDILEWWWRLTSRRPGHCCSIDRWH